MILDLPYAFSPDMSLRYENAEGSPSAPWPFWKTNPFSVKK